MKVRKIQSLLDRFPKTGYESPWLSYPVLYCVAVIFAIFYAYVFTNMYPDYVISADTPSYISAVYSIGYGKLDLLRTPIYPMVLGVMLFVFDEGFVIATILFQIMVFIASSFLFLQILSKFISSKKVVFWILAYYLLGIGFNQYNNYILTESLSISGMVIMLYFLLKGYPNSIKLMDVVCALGILFILVFLRPIFIYLIPVLVLYFICCFLQRRINVKVLISGLVGIGLLVTSVLGYTYNIQKTYGVKSMCIINTYNNYFTLRYACLPDVKFAHNPKLKEVIREINSSATINPNVAQVWGEIELLSNKFATHDYTPGELEEFVINSMKGNKLKCMSVLKSRILADETIFPILPEQSILGKLQLRLYPSFLISFIIFFVLVLYWGVRCKRERIILAPEFLFIMIVGGIWLVSLIGAYGDYDRLCVPVMPVFLIMLGGITNAIQLTRIS